MAKKKNVSINRMDEIVKEIDVPVQTVEWHGAQVGIRPVLSLREMVSFVDGVAGSCFREETNEYMPEVKDFAIKSNIIDAYTDIRMPDNIEHRYDLIYRTDIIETVCQSINRTQFNEMSRAIDDKIDNRAQANIEMLNRQMNELYIAFDNLQKSIAGVFNGVNGDDIAKIADAVSKGALDEEKLVKAYMGGIRDGDA